MSGIVTYCIFRSTFHMSVIHMSFYVCCAASLTVCMPLLAKCNLFLNSLIFLGCTFLSERLAFYNYANNCITVCMHIIIHYVCSTYNSKYVYYYNMYPYHFKYTYYYVIYSMHILLSMHIILLCRTGNSLI